MTEWGVVGVLVILVGLIASICGPLIKATKAITALTAEINFFRSELNEMKNDNKDFQKSASEKHAKIHQRIDGQDLKLDDHEKRIYKLENH